MALGCSHACGLHAAAIEVPSPHALGRSYGRTCMRACPMMMHDDSKLSCIYPALRMSNGWCGSGAQAPRPSSAPRCMRSWSHGCCRMAFSWSSWVALHRRARRAGRRGVPHRALGPRQGRRVGRRGGPHPALGPRGGLWLTLPAWHLPQLCGCLDHIHWTARFFLGLSVIFHSRCWQHEEKGQGHKNLTTDSMKQQYSKSH